MVSFAFNTMIGQVTPIAIDNIGWKYYILFVSLGKIRHMILADVVV